MFTFVVEKQVNQYQKLFVVCNWGRWRSGLL